MRYVLRIAFAFALVISCAFAANAANRVALVVGNSSYEAVPSLANPRNDAELIASALREVGFDVAIATDVDRRGLGRAIRDFGKALRRAGSDAVGLFYYAGHGIQHGGRNYLIPLHAQIENSADLEIEAVSADNILTQMEAAGNSLNFVVLDACRNNPFPAGRGATRGLARLNGVNGSLIAFAAAPGEVAQDGVGSNSPYAAALAQAIREPGLTVERVFKKVRIGVREQTGGEQTPWEESSLVGDFYFVPPLTSTPSASAPQSGQADISSRAATVWQAIQNTNSPAVLSTFIEEFSGTLYARFAQARLEEVRVALGVFPQPDSSSGPGELRAGDEYRDCDTCPKMLVLPAGDFTMGSQGSEAERHTDEGPVQSLSIERGFAVSRFEVTIGEFESFLKDTGYRGGGGCWSWDREWQLNDAAHYRAPGYAQSDDHPVSCVSLDDARAYTAWLSRKTGNKYRLLSEAEWEYAARAGRTGAYPFSGSLRRLCAFANGADTASRHDWRNSECRDGWIHTAPVGSLQPNDFGLHDMLGNLWEWVADCYVEHYTERSSNATAAVEGGTCETHVIRGGSWIDFPGNLRPANRGHFRADRRANHVGFRVAMTLPR